MSTLKLGLRVFLSMPTRDLSATDIAVRLPMEVANPRAIISGLTGLGMIERTGRQGRETVYRLVPGATLPPDGRTSNDITRARQVRQKRTLAAQARTMRLMKKIAAAGVAGGAVVTAVKKARRVRGRG